MRMIIVITIIKCRTLQHKVQDLINQGRLEVDNPLTIPNQNLKIYQNPLPSHQANTIASHTQQSQVVHKDLHDASTFVAMVSIATRAQRSHRR